MSACVYATQEELWEDLLYYALSRAQRERARLHKLGHPLNLSREYLSAFTTARMHLYNLAAREYAVSALIVEMARAEGLL